MSPMVAPSLTRSMVAGMMYSDSFSATASTRHATPRYYMISIEVGRRPVAG